MTELGAIQSDEEVGTAPFETQGESASAVAAHVALPNPHTQYTQPGDVTTIADAQAAAAVATHVALPNPHTQYTQPGDVVTIADAQAAVAVATHVGEVDPHPQYMRRMGDPGKKGVLQTQSGGGFVSYFQLTTPVLPVGKYEVIGWHCFSKSATNGDVDIQYELDSSTQLIDADGDFFREEPQDAGTDQRLVRPFAGEFEITVPGSTHTIDLMFMDNGGGTARMHGCYFSVYKVGN